MNLRMSPEFLDAYDIPILAGRNLSHDIANDKRSDELESMNILVNESALPLLGLDKPVDALNMRLYSTDPESTLREYVIVGVVPTQNIVGLFNEEKAWFYQYSPDSLRIGSIRITGGNMIDTVANIEEIWERVIPDFPIQGRFLDEVFDDIYNILKYMNLALGIFAFVALSLALIIALPAAYFASQIYLNFFADRIQSPIPILFVAGLIAVLLAWGTIAGHAIRIARSNPILALRYQ